MNFKIYFHFNIKILLHAIKGLLQLDWHYYFEELPCEAPWISQDFDG